MASRIEKHYELLEGILAGVANPIDLPLELLKDITEHFSEERIIGHGGFGTIYKGVLRNRNIAVKKLSNIHTDEGAFRRELENLMMINGHPNIVQFLGFCSNTARAVKQMTGSKETVYAEIIDRLLCFEYINNGSLDRYITDECRGLTWDTRFDIIRGVCEGLRYLHEDKSIIHMDLKPANILLDDHMVPKITDFGLARPVESTYAEGQHLVTLGYSSPEYLIDGQFSKKNDIYSLGIIIVELVTGSKHIPDETQVLQRWRHRSNKPPTQHQHRQVIKCMEIAVRCSALEPGNRPCITDIIRELSELRSTTGPIGQTSIYLYDDILGIEPHELRFPLEHNKQTSCSVELINKTINSIAFNIRTPSKQYNSQPDKGTVLPGRKRDVKIALLPQESATQITNSDKIVVQSTQVNEGLADEDITDSIFNSKGGEVVNEVNLMVVYEPEKYQVDLSLDRQEGAVSKEGINSMKSSQAYIVSYLTGSMNSLVDKLAEPYNRAKFEALHEDLVSLKKDLYDKLAGNGRRVANLQVKMWIKQVRELVFDIEDWIDGNPESIIDPTEREVKIHEFRTLINEACRCSERYNLLIKAGADVVVLLASNKVVSVDSPQPLGDKACDVVGLDGPKEMLKEHLLDGHRKMKVVSILGTGGLGKTTLAKELHVELQAEFPCVAFIYIGRKPSVWMILVNILYQTMSLGDRKAYFKAPPERKNDDFLPQREVILEKHLDEQQVIALLWDYLSKKRYFIVLDGIWSIRHWRVIDCAFPDNNLGSRILTTTRIMNVAESCSPGHTDVVYHMKALSKVESKRLFFGDEEKPADEDILKMCGGIPLAIILAAGVSKCEELVEPMMLEKSILSSMNQYSTSEGMTQILHMRYTDLSLPVRSCFLYLSIFPEDYTINKNRLIQLWRAEGFISQETRSNDGRRDEECLWVTGERYFNELVSKGLIQPVFSFEDDQAVGCKVHTVILDFIRSMSREENFATSATELTSATFPCDTVRRFSLDCGDEDEADTFSSSSVHLSSMRSLIVFGVFQGIPDENEEMYDHQPPSVSRDDEEMSDDYEGMSEDPSVSGDDEGMFDDPSASEDDDPMALRISMINLSAFKLLRVLDLEDTRNLRDHHLKGIGGLVLLRYLGLAGTGITLPQDIGKLVQLETLDCSRNGHLHYFPASAVKLQNLRHLLLEVDATNIWEIPELEGASDIIVESSSSLGKVVELLRKSVQLRMLGLIFRKSIPTETDLMSFIEEVVKSNLKSLSLFFENWYFGDEDFEILVNSWEKVKKFEPQRFELRINGNYYQSRKRVPPNMGSLAGLTHLHIKLDTAKVEDLHVLGGLTNLVLLKLIAIKYHVSGRLIIAESMFPCLKVLSFKIGDRWMGLEFNEGAMPQLQRLGHSFRARRNQEYPDIGLKHLTCLTQVHAIINCMRATISEVEAAEAAIRANVAKNTTNPTLELIRENEHRMMVYK